MSTILSNEFNFISLPLKQHTLNTQRHHKNVLIKLNVIESRSASIFFNFGVTIYNITKLWVPIFIWKITDELTSNHSPKENKQVFQEITEEVVDHKNCTNTLESLHTEHTSCDLKLYSEVQIWKREVII